MARLSKLQSNAEERLRELKKTTNITREQALKLEQELYEKAQSVVKRQGSSVQFEKNQKLLLERIERMPRVWSKMLGDKSVMLQLDELKTKIKSATNTTPISQLRKEVQLFEAQLDSAGLKGESFGDKVVQTGERLMAYFTNLVFYTTILGGLRNVIQVIKDLDLSLTELRKISDLSGVSLDKFVDKAFGAASIIGRTGKDLIDAVTEFRRAGYELDASFEMGQAALMMTNIGDNIKTTEEAASALIAVLRGFKNIRERNNERC